MKMKNKREEQRQKREKQKKERSDAKRKRRNTEPTLIREEATKLEKESFLIVCEGKNTEPSYFNKFKLLSAVIKSVGEGRNTLSLVKRAIQLSKQGQYDQIWCVFDKDDFPANNFNSAISKAHGSGFKVAYSNQAFEYWLILHFEDHQGGAMDRDAYCDKLNQYLDSFGVKYDCDNKTITNEVFNILISNSGIPNKTYQELACERAERNYNNFDHASPAKEESSTTVFKLIQEIIKFQ